MKQMTNQPSDSENSFISRPQRIVTHTICELRSLKYLPIFCHSAILFDLSIEGCKLQLTGEKVIKKHSKYWLKIPLFPLEIMDPEVLYLKLECVWFDYERFRVGGHFVDLTENDKIVLEKLFKKFCELGASAA